MPQYAPIATKLILSMDNKSKFKAWSNELYLLLSNYHLSNLILENNIKKIPTKGIKKDNLSKYMKVPTLTSMVYSQWVTQDMLFQDNQAKSLISNSINDEFKTKINVITDTAFEIYAILSQSCEPSVQERKTILLNELDNCHVVK